MQVLLYELHTESKLMKSYVYNKNDSLGLE